MAAKCDVCGKMTKKYHVTSSGDIVCEGTCRMAYHLESYLLRMEERRERDEHLNQRAYQEAREMSAWLSLYKYGNQESRKLAAAAITAWSK